MKTINLTISASICASILLATCLTSSVCAQSIQNNQGVHYSEISPYVLPANMPQVAHPQSSSAFKLNAQVTDAPQLSRDAGDLMLSHLAPAAQTPNASQAMLPVSPAAFKAMMPQHGAPAVGSFTAKPSLKAAVSAQQAPPPSYLTEYNVDWSTWISQMAARWHQNLRYLEESSNVGFHTVRPALIEFTCSNTGAVGNISLKQSSGVFAYDQLQMLALSQVTPLPPFPRGTRCATITLLQGWESHAKKPGDTGFDPRAFGKGFPMEKVKQWVRAN